MAAAHAKRETQSDTHIISISGWHYVDSNASQGGPISLEALTSHYCSGVLTVKNVVWNDAFLDKKWRKIEEIGGMYVFRFRERERVREIEREGEWREYIDTERGTERETVRVSR